MDRHDARAWPPFGADANGGQIPLSDKDIRLATELLTAAHAPSRFSLIGVIRDQDGEAWDLELVGWGIQWEDQAIACLPATPGRTTAMWSASSARSIVARQRSRSHDDLRLAWIDPDPGAPAPRL